MVEKGKKIIINKNNAGPVYPFGFFGALVYYFQQADTFWMVILGLLKAILWPGFLVYELLKLVNA